MYSVLMHIYFSDLYSCQKELKNQTDNNIDNENHCNL